MQCPILNSIGLYRGNTDMSLEILQELNLTLSKYLLDNFSISIADPVTAVILPASYLFMVLMALLAANIITKDTYSTNGDFK